jgi:hypothetical protein
MVFVNSFKKHFQPGAICPGAELYSPEEWDTHCSTFFDNLKNNDGLYVDIGTHHPYPPFKHFHQKGWQKITIEQVATSSNLYHLFFQKDHNTGAAPGIETDLNHHLAYDPEKKPIALPPNIKIVNVRKTLMSKILADNLPVGQTIDCLSLDAIGFDMMALKSNNWNKYFPLFIIVKVDTTMKNPGTAGIYGFLIQKNYKLIAKTPGAVFFKYDRN